MTTPLFGEKLHAPPEGNPDVHAIVAVGGLTKVPPIVSCVLAEFERLPAPMVTAEGAKAASLNCTTCSASVCFFVAEPALVSEVASRSMLESWTAVLAGTESEMGALTGAP